MRYLRHEMLGSQRNGLNHVGMNLGAAGIGPMKNRALGPLREGDPGVVEAEYPIYPDKLLNWYQTSNMKSVRFLFTWEAVQRTLGGPITSDAAASPDPQNYQNYWTSFKDVLTRLLARDIYVILCPWPYNPTSNDTDILYDGALFYTPKTGATPGDYTNFADFWGKFAAAINGVTGNDRRVAFDLINEPHEKSNKPGDKGITIDDWFGCAQAAITAIRNAGATNTIFIGGMDYASARTFKSNGSAARWLLLNDPQHNIAVTAHCYDGMTKQFNEPAPTIKRDTVLREACSELVSWARDAVYNGVKGVKVNIGEIALDAGLNGCSTFGDAQNQWSDWIKFCAANDDVIVGWNWWANGAGGWLAIGDSCSGALHWALTTDNGDHPTDYMKLIQNSLPTPALCILDNTMDQNGNPKPDTGAEPNTTTTIFWQSPEIWVGDGVSPIFPDVLTTVSVRVTNKGQGPHLADGGDVVRLYWAKAGMNLPWPDPWTGADPKRGGRIDSPKPVGALLPGASQTVTFNWTPQNPSGYPTDPDPGHFCLLAFAEKPWTPEFEGFEGSNLNDNVRRFSHVGWHNVHVETVAGERLGKIIVSNPSHRPILALIGFDILDDAGRPIDPARETLLITAEGAALEKLIQYGGDGPFLEEVGQGVFRLLDIAKGIPRLELRPGEILPLGLVYSPHAKDTGYAVRATQFSWEGASRRRVGGQTFVHGKVAGLTEWHGGRRRSVGLPLLLGSASLLLLLAWLRKGRRDEGERRH